MMFRSSIAHLQSGDLYIYFQNQNVHQHKHVKTFGFFLLTWGIPRSIEKLILIFNMKCSPRTNPLSGYLNEVESIVLYLL